MSRAKIVLITGTDTGVGKTFVTALCLKGIDKLYPNCKVLVCKPVETGCQLRDKQLIPADGTLLQAAGGFKQTLDEIVPYRFQLPLAPAVAKQFEPVDLIWGQLITNMEEMAAVCDLLLIEGAGGLHVPICDEKTYLNLAQEIRAEVLVVCANKLGVLNHASLTFESLLINKVPLIGYVLNQQQQVSSDSINDVYTTNRKALNKLADKFAINELAVMPFCDANNLEELLTTDWAQAFIQAFAYQNDFHPALEAICQI